MPRYAAVDDCVYPGTTVLRNKADLQGQAALDAFEADATAVRMLELLDQPIEGRFDFANLCAIHHHLFQDVYAWAGLTRQLAALADCLNSSLSLPPLQSDLKRALPNVEEIQNDLQQLQQAAAAGGARE